MLNVVPTPTALVISMVPRNRRMMPYTMANPKPDPISPFVIGDQIKAGTPQYAMYGFAAFYAICLVVNWWFYLRADAYVKNP